MENPYQAADDFMKDFRRMEYALKRSNFQRRDKKIAEADWSQFAEALGVEFFEHIVNSGIAKMLITEPPRRLLADLTWEPLDPSPLKNVTELIINGVCRVRNSYIHGEKFVGGPEGKLSRDIVLVHEAHAVLREAIRHPASPTKEEA